jgi:hypothetical protein
MDSFRVVAGCLLEEFCVGTVKHKHGYGEVGGLDVFGYLKEGVEILDVFTYVVESLDFLGTIDRQRRFAVDNNMIRAELQRMLRKADREWPTQLRDEYCHLMTLDVWNRGMNGMSGGTNDYLIAYWSFVHMSSLKGWSFNRAPTLYAEYARAWNASRARFAEVLP